MSSPVTYGTGVHPKANETVKVSATRADRSPKPRETNRVLKSDEETHIEQKNKKAC